jgi:hypothetical protein
VTDQLQKRATTLPLGRGQWGLFACARFSKGDYLCEYIGERISMAELDARYGDEVAPYAVTLPDGTVIDAADETKSSIARYANDCMASTAVYTGKYNLRNNADFVPVGGRLFLQATDTIEAGQEVFVSYGDVYWGNSDSQIRDAIINALVPSPSSPAIDSARKQDAHLYLALGSSSGDTHTAYGPNSGANSGANSVRNKTHPGCRLLLRPSEASSSSSTVLSDRRTGLAAGRDQWGGLGGHGWAARMGRTEFELCNELEHAIRRAVGSPTWTRRQCEDMLRQVLEAETRLPDAQRGFHAMHFSRSPSDRASDATLYALDTLAIARRRPLATLLIS